jgi:hypothetical protein
VRCTHPMSVRRCSVGSLTVPARCSRCGIGGRLTSGHRATSHRPLLGPWRRCRGDAVTGCRCDGPAWAVNSGGLVYRDGTAPRPPQFREPTSTGVSGCQLAADGTLARIVAPEAPGIVGRRLGSRVTGLSFGNAVGQLPVPCLSQVAASFSREPPLRIRRCFPP